MGEILNLIESVSGGFPSYFFNRLMDTKSGTFTRCSATGENTNFRIHSVKFKINIALKNHSFSFIH